MVKSGPFDQLRNMTCFHSQMGGIQNWFKQFQCAYDKFGDIILANDSKLLANSEEYIAKLGSQ